MPNQRSKDKAHLGGFVDHALNREIARLAKAEGLGKNKFGFVQVLIREALARRKCKKAAPAKKPGKTLSKG